MQVWIFEKPVSFDNSARIQVWKIIIMSAWELISGRSGLATDWNVLKMSNDRVRLILIKYTIGASGHTYLRAVKTP